jgi:chromosome segregation protein
MHLKSLTLKGFKSFPERTRLAFGPGVSVIVGPNGSGKSNVTDAVLWVLGEQSPLAVRGQSMQDVIFGGGHGRKAGSAAEVELVLDNADGTLGIDLAEVSIVRRLDRSGDGEYRLNGARCRLTDVLELLSDTGLGKEAHSVVSQGRVEAIVTSKPRDRRLLIEEAAGLGKHRKRRRRAQLKLERTQDNLDRALDVEREARSRLRPLKRQAEAAELHARIERQSLEARWELARDALRAGQVELEAAETAAAAARERREQAEAALAAVSARREAAEEALQQRGAEREALSERAFAARSAGERVGLRLESARATGASLAERIARHEAELSALRAQAEDDVPDEQAAERVAALEAELAELEQDRQQALERELAELEQRRAGAAEEAERLAAGAEQARAALAAADERVEAARGARREAEHAVEAARREAARVGGELAAANQFLRSQAGAPGGATALADELDVDSGFELALAAALDGRLRAAVVADRAAGAALLERAGRDGGSALIAGADAAALGNRAGGDGGAAADSTGTPGSERAAAGSAAARVAGSRAAGRPGKPPCDGARRLLDHVRGPVAALALAAPLLADTWVVGDVAQVPDDFRGTAVTTGGRVWIGAWRELRQVPAGGEERVLAERNRRDELIAGSEAAAQAEQRAAQGVEAAAAALAQADAARDEAEGALRAAVRAHDEASESEQRAARLIEQRKGAGDEGPGAVRRAQVEAELAAERRLAERAAHERAEREARIARAQARIERERALVPAAERLAAALAEAAAAIAARVEVFDAELAAHRAAGEHVAVELRACAREEAELQGRLRRDGEAVTGAEVRAQQARDRAADAQTELGGLAERLGLEPEPAAEPLPGEERDALAQRIERLARRREQLGPVNPLAQQEYEEAQAHVEELERQRNDLEAALRELQGLIRDTDREIRETFESTFAAAAKNFEELAEQLFPGGRGRLRLVREDAGPRPVLGGAKLGDGESSDAAPEAEEADADAAAEAEDRPEEDLLGVEIEITPAGKSMKRLSLLSGGEKSMTALAFLFSVFLARPCPFYILDEVEAALDDLNIDRFLHLLRRYSQRAQFIVVTHQKRTMEAADCLYGVSMGGDGVSKVISRRLPPAVEADAAAEVA